MRILMIHNYTQQLGGADVATSQEIELLQKYGHEVRLYFRHNDEIKNFSPFRKTLLFFEPTWSFKSYREIKQIIAEFKPDIAHCQSFSPLISPAVYYALAQKKIPIVQTLHEYRLICPIGWLFRNNSICEECVQHSLWRGIFYGCYRNSRIQTASVALMLSSHRLLKTWEKKINVFVTPTEFARSKLIEGGLPSSKIWVNPCFLAEDPGVSRSSREYVLYVGRLSPEKGLVTLLQAWQSLPDVPLKIVGDGPLKSWIEGYIEQHGLQQIELVGLVPIEQVLEYQKKAYFLVIPSIWYETFGRIIMEAYATGTPAIASRLGAMAELVEEERTGLLFSPGNADQLATKVRYALAQEAKLAEWGQKARSCYEKRFSADVAYKSLMKIYENTKKLTH